jgi:type III restriction enzyme
MITLKQYQKTAIESLLRQVKTLLGKDGGRICVFKAPTGSGKTIMVADFLDKLATEASLPSRYAFLWVSSHDLHKQSHDKLAHYLRDSRYRLSYLEDVQGTELAENQIVFINWESLTKKNKQGEYINTYMRDQESGRTLANFVGNSNANGIETILIVDESHHHYWSQQTQEFVQQVIDPKLTLEVSATPQIIPSASDLYRGNAGYVEITFEEVIAEGMIKSSVAINEALGQGVDLSGAADELVLNAALSKQQELLEQLATQGTPYRPLVLVQLPSESVSMSALDESKRQSVETYLRDTHDITINNGRLGIWLSNEKQNLDHTCDPDSAVDVLIFKQAIALGWDCPRAQILVMFRDIRSTTFEVQTVGRILRMPEAKHYGIGALDRAYVYTNLDRIQVKDDPADKTYFKTKQSFRRRDYTPIDLPSVYLSRTDYGDLTAAFYDCFYQSANAYFDIAPEDFGNEALAKVDAKLDLEPEELTTPVMVDVVVEDIDSEAARDIVGTNTIGLRVAEEDIKLRYEQFAKAASLPYAPVRSHGKIQQAIYQWFDNYLGYKGRSRLDIQRIVVCSRTNLGHFKRIMTDARDRFAVVDVARKQQQRRRQDEPAWNVPTSDIFGDNYLLVTDVSHALQPFYSEPRPSQPEQDFLEELRSADAHKWWYRNGTNKATYFAIPYLNEQDTLASSYPDFIVHFKDGRVGIYETKSGRTVTEDDTARKSDAIQAYIKQNSTQERPLCGGIVDARNTGLFVFTGEVYSKDPNHSAWIRLRF